MLRDYAAFAAWEYARAARQELETSLDASISRLVSRESRLGVDHMFAAAAEQDHACACGAVPRGVRTFVHLNRVSGEMQFAGAPLASVARALMLAQAPGDGDDAHARHRVHVGIIDVDGEELAVAWRGDTGRDGGLVHGFVADASFLTPMFEAAMKKPLLPPTLTARAHTDDVLAIRVTNVSGSVVFASPVPPSEYSSITAIDERLGGFSVSAALAPNAAESLVIGGLPTSRLPWLYGLIAAATALVGLALVQMRRQTELVNLRSQFVSGVSHELRTPLAQIRMFAETLVLGRVRSVDESRRSLEIILREAHRLSHLVDNVLCFSRAERGLMSVNTGPVSVQRLVTEVLETVQPFVEARRAAVHVAVPEGLTCVVDASAVRQMLLNLVDNALKYGPEGQTITLSAVRDRGVVKFSVEDEGPGIAADIAARIWEPFWRAPGSAQGGSGIGLSIVRDLTAAHRGRAFVDPACGRGARFVIELPDAA